MDGARRLKDMVTGRVEQYNLRVREIRDVLEDAPVEEADARSKELIQKLLIDLAYDLGEAARTHWAVMRVPYQLEILLVFEDYIKGLRAMLNTYIYADK